MTATPDVYARFVAEEARREAQYQEKLAQAKATCHIRKRAGKRMGNQFYSHSHRAQFRAGYVDPQSQTLCGLEATIADLSWADTRSAKSRAYIACQRCVELRTVSA
jgi:hypothetical protein